MSWFMIVFWSFCVLIVGYSIWSIRKNKNQTPTKVDKNLNQQINEANTYKDISRNIPPPE